MVQTANLEEMVRSLTAEDSICRAVAAVALRYGRVGHGEPATQLIEF